MSPNNNFAPKAPPAPARSPAKKAPRPAATKKKQAAPQKPAAKETDQTKVQKPKPKKVTQQLTSLLQDPSASARSVVDFVVGPTCGLESRHNGFCGDNVTPFLMAVTFNRLDVAQLLVGEHSVNTKAVADRNYTALHIASMYGHLAMVRYLVEQCGLDVQAIDVKGQSSLHWAINHRRSHVALLLLELGADPNQPDYVQWTPLHFACLRGLMGVARVLIAKGVDIDTARNGQSALHVAISYRHSDLVLLLLELGADPNLPNRSKSTPLHCACFFGLADVARALIAEGALRDAANSEGKTPLDIAIEYRHSELAVLLGASP